MARRDRTDIIHDMLVALRDKGALPPTRLMYKANLAHRQLKGYLEELVEKGLVAEERRKGRIFYTLTDDGARYLQKLEEMRDFEATFGLRNA